MSLVPSLCFSCLPLCFPPPSHTSCTHTHHAYIHNAHIHNAHIHIMHTYTMRTYTPCTHTQCTNTHTNTHIHIMHAYIHIHTQIMHTHIMHTHILHTHHAHTHHALDNIYLTEYTAKDLLDKTLVPDPQKRIKLNEMKAHPWMQHADRLVDWLVGFCAPNFSVLKTL